MIVRTFLRRARFTFAPLALALAAGCEGPVESSAPEAPSAAAAPSFVAPPAAPSSPRADSTPAVPGAAPPASGRAWMAAEIARLDHARPELVRALRELRPALTRGGRRRFVDERTAAPGAAAVLLDRLLARRDPPDVRRALAEVLPEIGCPCGDVLVDALDAEPEAEVRKAIVETLEHAPPGVAELGLLKAFSDRDAAVRAAAALVLPFCRSAGPGELSPSLRSALLRALDDSDASVQDEAARAAGIVRLAEAAPRLAARLSGPRAAGRLHALRALRRIDPGKARGLPVLSRLEADPDARVARLAASIAAEAP